MQNFPVLYTVIITVWDQSKRT